MPDDVCGQFALKSSLARAGFEHLMAGWIDPGFNSSVLTLEIKNARQYHAIPMWPGMRIGQIIFMRMASKPDVSYRDCGRYNSDKTVQESKGL
jgi:dCTP deaminase